MNSIKRLQSRLEASGSEPEERDSFLSSTGPLLSGQDSLNEASGHKQLNSLVKNSSSTGEDFRPTSSIASNSNNNNNSRIGSVQKQPEQQRRLLTDSIRSQTSGFEARKSIGENVRLIEELEESSTDYCCCCCSKSNKMTKAASFIMACFVAELIGTFLLVIIGDGVIATYVLTKQQVNVFVSCFAFGVGAMIATFATLKISGAHINPAASLAFTLDGRIKWSMLPVYLCAQYLGGFLAALVLFVNNGEAIGALDGGTRSAFGSTNSTGNIFATYPGNWVSVWGSLVDQIIGTAVLLFSQCAVGDKHNLALEDRHQPFILSLVIGLVCVAFNPNCGAIFNPARDLAPRILSYLVGYGPKVWDPVHGYYWLTAGVLGPHIGAILGVFAYRLIIGGALIAKRKHDLENQSLEQKHNQQQQQQLSKFVTRQTGNMREIGAGGGTEIGYGSSIRHN